MTYHNVTSWIKWNIFKYPSILIFINRYLLNIHIDIDAASQSPQHIILVSTTHQECWLNIGFHTNLVTILSFPNTNWIPLGWMLVIDGFHSLGNYNIPIQHLILLDSIVTYWNIGWILDSILLTRNIGWILIQFPIVSPIDSQHIILVSITHSEYWLNFGFHIPEDPCMVYMVTFTINIPPMLAYMAYMDPMGNG